jgi:hypothetical protein
MGVQRWQYKVLETQRTLDGGLPDRLKRLGADGWELTGVVSDHGRWVLFMKRPAQ